MKPTKIVLTIAKTFIIALCSACESADDRSSREIDIREDAYDEGYQDGYEAAEDDYDVFEGDYDDGYNDGLDEAAYKAYQYVYETYGIDDDTIIDYSKN